MEKKIPRAEHPTPQFERESWLNLNGTWQFEIDPGDSGRQRGLVEREKLDGTILVPFCPESRLSGVEHKDFMEAVWYKRSFTLPDEAAGKRVLLHFGAVDYHCEAWVNGVSIGRHSGGYSSFSFEITEALKAGENVLTVCAQDYLRRKLQPYGKQCDEYLSRGCSYTRTTGIWQTVWLEWVDSVSLESVRLFPDPENGTLQLQAAIRGCGAGCELLAEAEFQGKKQGSATAKISGNAAYLTLSVKEKHLWAAGQGNLYDLKLTLRRNGTVLDSVSSYFALRSVTVDGTRVLLNGKPVFQRLVLDQGFYPDGVYTAPSDEELKADVERSMAMGFNGARLHQKVFEQRFLYWADKLGYLCWGEMASWGADTGSPEMLSVFLPEWLEIVRRDFNAPCVIGWCPLNETWTRKDRDIHAASERNIYRATKAADPTRPVIDTSGGLHTECTDIFDTHDYEQDPEIYQRRYQKGAAVYDRFASEQVTYDGKKPFFISEYGGIGWSVGAGAWSYGNAPKTEREFLDRYKGLTDALLDNPDHFGFCYTQLTDIEQEQNGLYTYDRKAKFPPEIIHAINARKAAYEE